VLESLHIRNLALVEQLDIEFAPGFNVVTGETGAGKSLVLGALQILMGDRTSKTVIRRDTEQCDVSACIGLSAAAVDVARSVADVLDRSGAPACEDGVLLLRRVITATGNRVYINAAPATVGTLTELGELLIDIHGPNNTYSLLKPKYQLELLDRFAELTDATQDCVDTFEQMHACRAELESLTQAGISDGQLDLLRHQLREIENADLQSGEDEELAARYDVAANARDIIATASQCQRGLDGDDGSVTEQLAQILRMLHDVEAIDANRGGALRTRLEEIIEQVHDLGLDMTDYAESLEVDEQELQRLEDRLDTIQKLKRKYGPSIDDVLATAEDVRSTLQAVDDRSDRITTLQTELDALRRTHLAKCAGLTEGRRAAGQRLAGEIGDKLCRLGFLQSAFEIRFADVEPGPRGADRIDFCFSPNPGEPVLPLRQIASSGEIARTMLAIKTVLATADSVPVLVFDEVDANIGGRVAVTVAEELAAVGRSHQTLCISHLPQIAAVASRHFLVTKDIVDGRTVTRMKCLDSPDREQEVARMLGAAEGSSVGLEHAREMLAQRSKQPILQ